MIAALLAACAVWLAVPEPVRLRRSRVAARVPVLPMLLAAAAGMGLALGGAVGVVIACALVIAARRRLTGAAAREERRQRLREQRELPAIASLLAALLESGATIERSVAALAQSHTGAAAPSLQRVAAAMHLGAGPQEAWNAASIALTPIAEALQRSATTGAPAATLLAAVAVDEQRVWQSRAEVAARSAGVRAILPLVVCFLPAFFLVGVVPVIVSVARSLLR